MWRTSVSLHRRHNQRETRHYVRKAAYDTTKDTFSPSLLELRDSVVLRLQEANLTLDSAISSTTDEQVIQLLLNLNGREVRTPEEVKALLAQLEERLLGQLDGKPNICVRLVYDWKKYGEMS